MSFILYCGVCTMPLEYCRYHPKYDKCLEWMKKNQPELFSIEIKDLPTRNPKIAKKTQHLWDENAKPPQQEEKKDNNNPTKKPKQISKKIKKQQKKAQKQMDILNKQLNQLSTKGDNQNKNRNTNDKNTDIDPTSQEEEPETKQEPIDEFGLGRNTNRDGGPPPRKLTKKQKGGKKGRKGNRRKGRKGRKEESSDSEEKENKDGGGGVGGGNSCKKEMEDEEREKRKRQKYLSQFKNKKIPKERVEVSLENRKGNKRVTVVRGYLEKTKFKDKDVTSAFRKKFATSVSITYQNPGSEKGPKQIVLMGDKRMDFMRYLKEKFPKVATLLYYKTKRFGITPAIDPNHGFIMAPP